jgi:DNA-binding NtrC family response regulator
VNEELRGARVLIVEDDARLAAQLEKLFAAEEAEVQVARDLAAGRRLAASHGPDVTLLDFELPDGTALDLLPHLLELDPEQPVLVLTGHGEIDLAVACIKAGAQQFLTKPVELAALRKLVEGACEQRRLRRRDAAGSPRAKREVDPFVGVSRWVRSFERQARVAAGADSSLLLIGETGTGKGVLARWLHANGPRAAEAFVDLNCAALSRELLDSELFGHVRGAFTGAVSSKAGLFEVADRGVLFLDEIGDAELAIQPKILKAVEEKRFRRLGENQERRVDVRLFAATHRDLAGEVEGGRFRADLYYRLNTVTLHLAPLRERREDIPALAEALLRRIRAETGREVHINDETLSRLVAYDWPGNIRELANALERIALFGDLTPRTAAGRAPTPVPPLPPESDGDLRLATAERRHIEHVLRREGGNVDRTAELLGVPRSTLYQRIKEHGLSLAELRRGVAERG